MQTAVIFPSKLESSISKYNWFLQVITSNQPPVQSMQETELAGS